MNMGVEFNENTIPRTPSTDNNARQELSESSFMLGASFQATLEDRLSIISQENSKLSCRIVSMDHYLAPPVTKMDPSISHFRAAPIYKVPVIRIFGSTPAGMLLIVEICLLINCY